MRSVALLLAAAAAALVAPAVGLVPGSDLPKVAIDPSRVTVSGISSGAFMAVQLHVAYSKTFAGVGVLGAWAACGRRGGRERGFPHVRARRLVVTRALASNRAAGGPYWCAQDLIPVALTSCMSSGGFVRAARPGARGPEGKVASVARAR